MDDKEQYRAQIESQMTQFHEHLEQVIAHSKEKKIPEPANIPISGLVQKRRIQGNT